MTTKMEPGTEVSTSDTTGLNFTLDERVLRIEHPGGDAARLKWKLIRLKGSPPKEYPSWRGHAHTSADHRDLAPLTLEFKSKEPDDIFADRAAQDGIRRALWATLEELLAETGREVEQELPRISFDELRQPERQSLGLIDLVFSSGTALRCVREKLRKIDLGVQGNERRTYTFRRETNSLPANVFAFDCLNLPVEDINRKGLFSAFASMTEELGALMGIAEMVVCSADQSTYSESGTVRGYIELERRWMAVPLKDVVARLPSSFVWYGKRHKLLYSGLDLRTEHQESAHYPLSSEEEEEEDSEDSETSETSDSSETDDEDGKARKKRKMEKE